MSDATKDAIEWFEVEVRHGTLKGFFDIAELAASFKRMRPSLHRHCEDENIIDVDALLYTTARLPEGVHTVREVLLQKSVPSDFAKLPGIEPLRTPSRRRASFRVGPETIVIVAREDITEILDLVSIFTSYYIEASKIHRMLRSSYLLDELRKLNGARLSPSSPEYNRFMVRLVFEFGTSEEQLELLNEKWKGQLFERLQYIGEHMPSIHIRLHKAFHAGTIPSRAPARNWSKRIAEHVRQISGGEDRPIHIISSNTHSTVNVLSSYARIYGEKVIEWGRANSHDDESRQLIENHVNTDQHENLIYYLLKGYLREQPEIMAEKQAHDLKIGISVLPDVFMVGIDCQVLDLCKIDFDLVDKRLELNRERIQREKPIIINFDYAFGEQAGTIIEELILNFRKQIVSFSIMGKAGTVVGERGGIMIPSYLLQQGRNDIYDIPNGNQLTKEDFKDVAFRSRVHVGGPMLTVLGTVLQNNSMLREYKEVWGILGLEMEGIPYIRKIHQCHKLGYLREDIKINIGYYASDVPLVPGETLSRELSFAGVDATYGINIAILNKLFS
ncbi:MAG: hypothetical protein RMM17_08510 [Acidobacteriota bacterium]|nr:hypothetical protein [Blastocatellia bacterium]MDW8412709.1 hypothetical protein [Acidobacteriota bacterium]